MLKPVQVCVFDLHTENGSKERTQGKCLFEVVHFLTFCFFLV